MPGKPQHGESQTPEGLAWRGMVRRCHNPDDAAYSRYGGRGIRVCDRWLESIAAFIDDMGRKPSPAREIDRIDNDKGYEPDNCRWATRKENDRNRRSNHSLTVNGETLTIAGWAERTGIGHATITKRLGAGWSAERAVTTPVGPSGPKRRGA